MTPQQLITENFVSALEDASPGVPAVSLLMDALEGTRSETPSSFIAVSVDGASQLHESVPVYRMDLSAELVVAVDDDKGASLFRRAYESLWRVFDSLARADNCVGLGDAGEAVFAVDGFQLSSVSAPSFSESGDSGYWSCTFTASVTGRAP